MKGYNEAAKTMDTGAEVVMSIPKAPVKDDVYLQDKEKPAKELPVLVFDAMAAVDDNDEAPSKEVKDETEVSDELLEAEREQVYQTLLEVHKKEIDLFVKAKSKLKEGKTLPLDVFGRNVQRV